MVLMVDRIETIYAAFRIINGTMATKKQYNSTIRSIILPLAIFMLLVLFLGQACELSGSTNDNLSQQPEPDDEHLFRGVRYIREVRTSPHPMVIHVVVVNLKTTGIRTLVTPPEDAKADEPLVARTTSAFVRDFGVQVAINGSGFKPWYVLGPIYYPHSGDTVRPLGYAVSRDVVYSENTGEQPILYFNRTNTASILNPTGSIWNAIAGMDWLLQNGEALDGLDTSIHPRTGAGINRAGTKLILAVVDGRQPGYSDGATLPELVDILRAYGAWDGISMDGGGSSTLVVQGEDGEPKVLNSPIHLGIPGNERPVGNHLGIFAKPK
jgi:hypothetical protein